VTVIGEDLRAVIYRARTNPVRWGRSRGLRQQDLAELTSVSTVYIRQIESGYRQHARASTLGNICYTLGMDAEFLRDLGYPDIADIVADCVDAAVLLGQEAVSEDPPETAEEYLRDTPGLSDVEKEQLIEALNGIRKTDDIREPLGRDLWRHRGVS
jgi:transcriptional regulator with XRE-family HTH domain